MVLGMSLLLLSVSLCTFSCFQAVIQVCAKRCIEYSFKFSPIVVSCVAKKVSTSYTVCLAWLQEELQPLLNSTQFYHYTIAVHHLKEVIQQISLIIKFALAIKWVVKCSDPFSFRQVTLMAYVDSSFHTLYKHNPNWEMSLFDMSLISIYVQCKEHEFR